MALLAERKARRGCWGLSAEFQNPPETAETAGAAKATAPDVRERGQGSNSMATSGAAVSARGPPPCLLFWQLEP
jgi:hypothetical protein